MKIFIVILISIISNICNASSTNVFLGERLCTNNNYLCITGTMEYEKENKKLEFNGKVNNSVKEGMLTILMTSNETGQININKGIKGKYSEILKIKSKKIHRAKKNTKWRILEIRYNEFK